VTDWVGETDRASGIAVITVYRSDNAILVVPGANAALTPADLDAAQSAFASSDIVVAQLEVPMPTVAHAAELAQRHGKPFVLNPAPATRLPQSLIDRCTLLTPNEYELATALGATETGWSDLLRALPGRVVMTKGAEGAYFRDAGGTLHCQKGFAVTPVDTTGAGDTFVGAIAAFWDLGLQEAVRRGCAAGALSVTKPGARGGMPTAAELQAFLEKAG
jgi:ribokinase